jgi:thymidine kinase
MALLIYYYGPMSSGKSTMALQMDHTLAESGLTGLLLTQVAHWAKPYVVSRLGVDKRAVEFDGKDLFALLMERPDVRYVIVDEAQFLQPEQVEQLCRAVDNLGVNVHAFGLKTDFRGEMFPGSRRLLEMADMERELPVPVYCWCGDRGRFNARIVDGVVARQGEQVLVGDVVAKTDVFYRILCRRHFLDGTWQRS